MARLKRNVWFRSSGRVCIKKRGDWDFFVFIFGRKKLFKKKEDNIFLTNPQKSLKNVNKNCGSPIGHNCGHPLDWKHKFFLVWPDYFRLGSTNCEPTAPPFLKKDSPWFCHLQIYSPLFSWIPKNSPLKSAIRGEFSVLHISSYFTKLLF